MKLVVLGVDFLAMALLFGYWEYRYQVFGWGRGGMKAVPHHRPSAFPQSYPEVWDLPWEFDVDLPSVDGP